MLLGPFVERAYFYAPSAPPLPTASVPAVVAALIPSAGVPPLSLIPI